MHKSSNYLGTNGLCLPVVSPFPLPSPIFPPSPFSWFQPQLYPPELLPWPLPPLPFMYIIHPMDYHWTSSDMCCQSAKSGSSSTAFMLVCFLIMFEARAWFRWSRIHLLAYAFLRVLHGASHPQELLPNRVWDEWNAFPLNSHSWPSSSQAFTVWDRSSMFGNPGWILEGPRFSRDRLLVPEDRIPLSSSSRALRRVARPLS